MVYLWLERLFVIKVDQFESVFRAAAKTPFRYRPVRTFEDVSRNLLTDLMQRVFRGSREMLLVQILGERKKLSEEERALLEQVLKEQEDE